jgi:nitroimidazol reductase NimA-like FMN-containing flavoprotein (pyridoxamine 5'-phosphate oxidase superfamily)
MPSRRDLIRMTPDEIWAYLDGQRRIILVTNGANGLPHPVPMNFGIDAEKRVIITSFTKAQKVKNLERDPRATLLVESGTAYAEMQAVIMYANCEIIREEEEVREVMKVIRADRGITITPGSERAGQIDASKSKRVALRFTPFQFVSWDHAKLGAKY